MGSGGRSAEGGYTLITNLLTGPSLRWGKRESWQEGKYNKMIGGEVCHSLPCAKGRRGEEGLIQGEEGRENGDLPVFLFEIVGGGGGRRNMRGEDRVDL